MARYTFKKKLLKNTLIVLIFLLIIVLFFKNSENKNNNNVISYREPVSIIKKVETTTNVDELSDVKDWHNYTQIEEESKRRGPGEQGSGVHIPKEEADMVENIYRVNGFNGYASDKMAIQRSMKDIRHPDCKRKKYLRELPSVSVVIPFHQEHWSTLIRSVDSVLRRSPKGIIKEVILVDDASTKDFLKKPLELYLEKHYPIARVVRTNGRQGLIRGRILGAENAKYDILIFLDSHVEANVNWLPPLIEPIAKDYKTVTCPFIDVINMDTFEYFPQDEGARGVFNWRFNYKRIPRLKSDANHPSDPFESPVMAGGLFAISRKWFWELGGYDRGLDIWGGEQYELSFKLWQCGGRMLDIPCSRIGHVYRKFAPFPNNAKGNFVRRNFKRVALVWMDNYIKYLYLRDPPMKDEDPLDLTEQRKIREKLKCRNFTWFMNEVAFDLVKKFPLIDPDLVARGQIQLLHSDSRQDFCIHFPSGISGDSILLKPCSNTGAQDLDMTHKGEIHPHNSDHCMDCADYQKNGAVLIFTCHGNHGNQYFKYNSETNQIVKVSMNTEILCIHGNSTTSHLTLQRCDEKSEQIINGMKWKLNKINLAALKKLQESHEQ